MYVDDNSLDNLES